MFRKSQLQFRLATVATDAVAVFIATWLVPELSFSWPLVLTIIVASGVALAAFGEYDLERTESWFWPLVRLALSLMLGFCIGLFCWSETWPAKAEAFRWLALALSSMVVLRTLVDMLEVSTYRRGQGQIPIIIVGMSRAGESFLRQVVGQENYQHLKILGFVDNSKKETVHGVEYLGKLVELESKIKDLQPVAIIQVGLLEQKVTVTALCQQYNLEYYILPSLIGAFSQKVSVSRFLAYPLITVKESNLFGWSFVFKRLFDVVVGSILLILSLPIMLIAAIAIMIERKSFKVIVREGRIDGRSGREFQIYRFITLRDGEHETPLNSDELKLHANGKIKDKGLAKSTTLGRFLRQSEINELPQLINVLQNRLSLIGPRPAFPSEVTHYTNFHAKRLRLKPGLTGYWQIKKDQTAGKLDDLLAADIYYIENWSLGLDVWILLCTLGYVVREALKSGRVEKWKSGRGERSEKGEI